MYTNKQRSHKKQTPQEQLKAAIARMQKGLEAGKDYRVCATGKRLDTGEAFYCVPSDSEKLRGLWHVVTVKKAGGLSCDCIYSQRGMVCTHRATVYCFLQAKAAAAKAAEASATAPAPKAQPAPAVKATPAPKVERTKANALPADRGYNGSIFKSESAEGEYIPRDHYQHAYK